MSANFPRLSDGLTLRMKVVKEWPFQPVGVERGQFDYAAQIDGCGRLIDAIRHLAGPELWATFKNSGTKKNAYGRILKKSLKDAIRISGESLGYMLTVDYITCNAMDLIVGRSGDGKVGRKHIMGQKRELHHEHMVPGEELCCTLVSEGATLEQIKSILSMGSSRAIVCQNDKCQELCERRKVDARQTKQCVPDVLSVTTGLILRKEEVPPELRGLFRYHHAGLIDQLVPVSERGCFRLEAYRTFIEKILSARR